MGHVKRIAMLSYLVAFALVETTTDLFAQYPLAKWAGLVVVLAILVEAARCARHQWQELTDDATPSG